jgi:hypothetical protein
MELTVVRARDERRMVVTVDAATESEALAKIVRAIGEVAPAPTPRSVFEL